MNLIVVSSLTTNEGLYFRFLTMVAQRDLEYCVAIECLEEEIDSYYNLLKRKGWFDFVNDFVLPEWQEEGIRIDTELNYPRTIKIDVIECGNTPNLLGQLKTMRQIQ